MKYDFKHQRIGDPGLTHAPNVTEPYSPFVPTNNLLKHLEDVYILSPYGLILDSNFEPLWHTANDVIFWTGRPVRFPELLKKNKLKDLQRPELFFERSKGVLEEAIKTAIQSDRKKQLSYKRDYIYLVHPLNEMVFGHFYDTMQRLFQVKDENLRDPHLIVSEPNGIKDFHRHIELLGFNPDVCVREKHSSLMHVPSLYVPELSCGPMNMTAEVHDWIFSKYIHENPQVNKTSCTKYKLYLDRSSVGRSANRDFTNANLVRETMADQGFVSHFQFNTLDNMLNAFYNAEIVIGVHGAAFSNCMFVGEQTKIFEFIPHNRPIKGLAKLPKKTVDHWLITLQGNKEFNISPPIEFIKHIISGAWLEEAMAERKA